MTSALGLRKPTEKTLKKYGLTPINWEVIAYNQGYACAVCKQLPTSGRLHIDHEHIRGWKKKNPIERRQYVRGLLCFRCNTTFVGRGASVERSLSAAGYLQQYRERNGT